MDAAKIACRIKLNLAGEGLLLPLERRPPRTGSASPDLPPSMSSEPSSDHEDQDQVQPVPGRPSRLDASTLADARSVLLHLSRDYSSSQALTHDLFYSPLTRPQPPSASDRDDAQPSSSTFLQPALQSTSFSLFPLPVSAQSPASSLPPPRFTLAEEIPALASRQIRAAHPGSDGLDPRFERALVAETVRVLDEVLLGLAARTPASADHLRTADRKKRREKEKGWESVLVALWAVEGVDIECVDLNDGVVECNR